MAGAVEGSGAGFLASLLLHGDERRAVKGFADPGDCVWDDY